MTLLGTCASVVVVEVLLLLDRRPNRPIVSRRVVGMTTGEKARQPRTVMVLRINSEDKADMLESKDRAAKDSGWNWLDGWINQLTAMSSRMMDPMVVMGAA